MTQEEKQLLFIDLCARLPYNVIVSKSVYGHDPELYYLDLYKLAELRDGDPVIIKPYLRPMSSMTEEEREEFNKVGGSVYYNPQNDTLETSSFFTLEAYDWLNANMFDYRGLIPMGIALEAPDGMYK